MYESWGLWYIDVVKGGDLNLSPLRNILAIQDQGVSLTNHEFLPKHVIGLWLMRITL